MSDIAGKTVLITGSTDGIGKRTAHDLAAMGATVLMHGRNAEKGAVAMEEIAESTGNDRLRYYNADLSSLDDVRWLASRLEGDDIDVLINNAGIGTGPQGAGRELSHDGHELRLAVNYLAPFLLSHLLLPNLRRAEPSRIVNVASLGQSRVDLDDLMMERGYDPWDAYGRSKLALVMFTIELAERLGDTSITVNAVHPGTLLDTEMVRESGTRPRGDVQEGADSLRFLATSPSLDGLTGRFFDRRRETRADGQAYDATARRALYRKSVQLTGLAPEHVLPEQAAAR
ncbi:MAG: SDR family NAD(P)-dependent oxidoreductase [Methanomassiliicoccaceae archaeon]|jgi:NAD(P)-dependent dehydrogenase (short-subunit alcohol dehydrogenase family)|nr:SDR family NAD(P)-dependent oxidoreductase [Euryarchaeota archaeon]HOB38775.1 SDR family NAD(P)-dependent oxidoreductase [Methanomassiliicoccaceae archaeon]HQA21499.1 SDR family NAD(P)-dependent oxidoreductase [Methanomassiliicoccaceae archaeon]HQD88524.1 SDR family NAD(P)-dependent oxidoreductase [Methanomassiliicoccaceae archaeon]